MPYCPQCDNRYFANKEALLQHMKSSSAWHPFCGICDRRFVSDTAYDAHMTAKHPPTFDCTTCNRSYHAQFALEDHYRGSNAHPNCARCGRGAKDAAAIEEHLHSAHPRVLCEPCGKLIYEEDMERHFLDSTNHPSCALCSHGFKDDATYSEHIHEAHPDLRCDPCQRNFGSSEALRAHYLSSLTHPKCSQCEIGFKNKEEHLDHIRENHSSPPAAPEVVDPIVEDTLYSTGFTPLSPRNRFKDLITGEKRTNSPELRLNMGFASPIKEVKPLFSPVLPLPGKAADELWSSRENVQVATARFPHRSPEKSLALIPSPVWSVEPGTASETSINNSGTSPIEYQSPPRQFENVPLLKETFSPTPSHSSDVSVYRSSKEGIKDLKQTLNVYSPPQRESVSLSSYNTPLSGIAASDSLYHIPRASSFVSTGESNQGFSQRSPYNFHPRLYPGSVRHAARTAQGNLDFPTGYNSIAPYATSYRSRSTHSLGSLSISSSSTISTHSSREPLNPYPTPLVVSRRTAMSETIDWQEVLGSKPAVKSEPRFDDASILSEVPTPRVDTPVATVFTPIGAEGPEISSVSGESIGDSQSVSVTLHSPPTDISSLSSATPESFHEDFKSDTQDFEDFEEPETRPTTATSSSRTATSLLAVPTYKITPSSECPSPRSPEVMSPIGLATLPQISPLPSTPLDIDTFDIPEAKKPLPDSPITVVADLEMEKPTSPVESSPQHSFAFPLQEHSFTDVPTGSDSAAPGTVASTVSSLPAQPPNPLHCRKCKKYDCEDITATMCGHIFCYSCITDSIIKTSRCPVCSTPTLLYCLFRLDLSA